MITPMVMSILLSLVNVGEAPPKAAAATKSPVPTTRWDTETAGHLLRRAGFGGTPQQVQFLAGLGREKAVDYLVDYDKVPFTMPEPKVSAADITYGEMRQKSRGMSEEDRKKMQQRFRVLQEMTEREMT